MRTETVADKIERILGDRAVDLINELSELLIDPASLVALLFAFAMGWLYSLTPYIKNKARASDRKLHVYGCDAIVAAVAYIALNRHEDPKTVLASLLFVIAASVLLPLVYFTWLSRR